MPGMFSGCCCTSEPDILQAVARHGHFGYPDHPSASGSFADDAEFSAFIVSFPSGNGSLFRVPFALPVEHWSRGKSYLKMTMRKEGTDASASGTAWEELEYHIDRHTGDVVYQRFDDSNGNHYVADSTPGAPYSVVDGTGAASVAFFGGPWYGTSSYPYSYGGTDASFEKLGFYDTGSGIIDVRYALIFTFADPYTTADCVGDTNTLLGMFSFGPSIHFIGPDSVSVLLTGRWSTANGLYVANYQLHDTGTSLEYEVVLTQSPNGSGNSWGITIGSAVGGWEFINGPTGANIYVIHEVPGEFLAYGVAAKAYFFGTWGPGCEDIKAVTPAGSTDPAYQSLYSADVALNSVSSFSGTWAATSDDTVRLAWIISEGTNPCPP